MRNKTNYQFFNIPCLKNVLIVFNISNRCHFCSVLNHALLQTILSNCRSVNLYFDTKSILSTMAHLFCWTFHTAIVNILDITTRFNITKCLLSFFTYLDTKITCVPDKNIELTFCVGFWTVNHFVYLSVSVSSEIINIYKNSTVYNLIEKSICFCNHHTALLSWSV